MTTGNEFNAPNHQGVPQGWVRRVITRWVIFKSFFDMILKIGPFSKKGLQNWGYRSITLEIILWAPYTITHAVTCRLFFRKNIFCDTPVASLHHMWISSSSK
jgi:hypothetical protein